MDAVFEARAVTNEVEPKARPLALGADGGVGQPDRRYEVAPGELGEHAGVDLVGLAGERCEPLDLLGVGDRDLPARELELVVDEARPVHRLDRRAHRSLVAGEPARERAQTVGIGGRGTRLDGHPVRIERAVVDALAAAVQSYVQH